MNARKADLADIKPLAKLFDDYRVFYEMPSDLMAAEKFLYERIEKQESEIVVAVNSQNELAGFVQLYPIFSSTRMKRLWLLNDLFVHQRFRGMGVSVLLINAAKTLCQTTAACGLILETSKNNKVGNNLYVKTGFLLDADHNYYAWDLI